MTLKDVLQCSIFCIQLSVLLQGFCVSCLFCFANMDVHYAMLPLLKQLFGSCFEGDNAITVQRANTLTHSTRDLCVWPCFRVHRELDLNTWDMKMFSPNQMSALSWLQFDYGTQTKTTVTAQYCAVQTLKFITATRDQKQNTTWTSSILSPISWSSILILYFWLHFGPHKWPQRRMLTKRFYCTKHVWHNQMSFLMASTFTGHVSELSCACVQSSRPGVTLCNMNASN